MQAGACQALGTKNYVKFNASEVKENYLRLVLKKGND